jgi:hypothetical protein
MRCIEPPSPDLTFLSQHFRTGVHQKTGRPNFFSDGPAPNGSEQKAPTRVKHAPPKMCENAYPASEKRDKDAAKRAIVSKRASGISPAPQWGRARRVEPPSPDLTFLSQHFRTGALRNGRPNFFRAARRRETPDRERQRVAFALHKKRNKLVAERPHTSNESPQRPPWTVDTRTPTSSAPARTNRLNSAGITASTAP